MSDSAVSITRISIHRVPGIPRDHGFSIDELSHGVNIIYGPNGSGKSTTARCLHGLLWPYTTGMERPSFSGEFGLNEHVWSVEVDAGYPRVRRDGEHADVPSIGPAENRRRYHLALDELIQKEADHGNFAKIIAEESHGGYDLETAAERLGFRDKPKNRSKERKTLDEAKGARQEAQRRQEDLDDAARGLNGLRRAYEDAKAAERRLDAIERAIDYRSTESRRREIQTQLEHYPSAMHELRGDERETLDRLASQQQEYEKQRSDEEERSREARRTAEGARLSGDGVDPLTLDELKSTLSELARCEEHIRTQQSKLAEARTEAANAAAQIGTHPDRIAENELSEVPIATLDGFLPEVERIRGREAVLEEQGRRLDSEALGSISDVQSHQLHDGIRALARWIATPPEGPRAARLIYWAFVASSVVAVGLCAVLGLLHEPLPWWIAGGLLLALSMFVAWRRKGVLHDPPGTGDRVTHRRTYEETGLQPPDEWEHDSVARRVRELAQLLADRQLEDEREERRRQLSAEQAELDRDRRKLDTRRAAIEEQLGVRLEIDNLWFTQLATRIGRWWSAGNDAARAQAALTELEQRRDGSLSAINARLRPFGYSPTDSASAAEAAIRHLEERDRRYRQAIASRDDAERRLRESIRPSLERVARDREALFRRLGIGASDASKIDEWLEDHRDFTNLRDELSRVDAVSRDKRQSLSAHPDLLAAEMVELEQRREEARTTAAEKDELQTRIISIERDIETAKEGHALSDALAAEEEARSELRRARNETRRALVGNTLARWVQTEAIERARPRVFVRASEILQRFTNHTLQLEINDRAGASEFLARRLNGDVSPLSELSVGERLQLLIAVRMAFVEQDEQAKLPLLLDETLGTSDDTRAGVIIDTIIDIARDGRQVFYFTAQHDEVAKWNEKLQGKTVSSRQVDLARVRGASVAEMTPLVFGEVERPAPPRPEGEDYAEYGETLNVPGLNPMHTTPDEVHVWHLFRDTNRLYKVLRMGVSRWGQLRIAQTAHPGSLVEQDLYEGAAAAARAIGTAFDAWRVGRGKPVDRAVLDESGAVSDTFIDAVVELAKEVDGNAARLVEALERGRVNRWRQEKTQDLRTFFLDNGYLSTENRLSRDEIRIRVIASVSDALEDGRIDESLIDRIVGSLPE
jgi:DNA repair exonuclease SbcCD ATPase subunit